MTNMVKETYVTKVTKRKTVAIPAPYYKLLEVSEGQHVRVTIDTELSADA